MLGKGSMAQSRRPLAPYAGGPLPGRCRGGGLRARKCPLLVSDVLLSHGLTPQYHRRSGA